MKLLALILTIGFGIVAASAQVIPYFPPFISALPSGRDAAVAHKLSYDRRFSIPSTNRDFIESVIKLAKAQRRTVRTERVWVKGTEFVNITVSERK